MTTREPLWLYAIIAVVFWPLLAVVMAVVK